MDPVRWGVLSTAKIGREKVIPAMQAGANIEVVAIASRDGDRARQVAGQLGIPQAYGSYEELIADPTIEAVYNPVPNHLHVPLSIQAADAGKHVLCEKPIALNAAEAETLVAARDRNGVYIEEAFMVRNHPQWLQVRDMVRGGRIGTVRSVQVSFTYNNVNPDDVRNQADIGGGAIYDIGAYAITFSRFVYESEPRRVVALIDRDPTFRTDRMVSAILDFPEGQAIFFVSTQTARHQRVQILGTEGWIAVETPVIPPPTHRCRIHTGPNDPTGSVVCEAATEVLDPVDQYTLQGERFSRLIRTGDGPQWPLETAVAGMRVIDALYRSGASGAWEAV